MTGTKMVVTIVVIALVLLGATILLLQLAVTGNLPTGFGLWNAGPWSTRILTAAILVAVAVVLGLWYRAVRPKTQ